MAAPKMDELERIHARRFEGIQRPYTKADVEFTESRAWDMLGMRGTENISAHLQGTVPVSQIVGNEGEFGTIAVESMIPAGHVGWSACWLSSARVAFARLNLSAPPFPMSGPLDVVFCRNVMIYFDQPVRQGLIAEIERLLAPGGLLMIGHAETLNGVATGLRPIYPSMYRKPLPGEAPQITRRPGAWRS